MFNNIRQFVENAAYIDPGSTVKRIIKPKANELAILKEQSVGENQNKLHIKSDSHPQKLEQKTGGKGTNWDGDHVMELLNRYAKSIVKLLVSDVLKGASAYFIDLVTEIHMITAAIEHLNMKSPSSKYGSLLENIKDLENRFPDLPQLESFSVFDPNSIPGDQMEVDGYGREKIEILSDHFKMDLVPLNQAWRLLRSTIQTDDSLKSLSASMVMQNWLTNHFRPLQNGFSAIQTDDSLKSLSASMVMQKLAGKLSSDPFRPLKNGFSAIKPGVEATEEHHSN
ncbi:unnamed protein product [Mytilus edulis]|uniref:Uncharacterized protein n=1 Tax=Mytilus edulis TaxID=6550 RepID=A0A8S3TH66_MYTED|nr:unnamed protein product [Mytilus edulis]